MCTMPKVRSSTRLGVRPNSLSFGDHGRLIIPSPRPLTAIITLLTAKYPDHEPLRRGCRLIMSRQLPDGSWPQESIEGSKSKH